VIDVRGHLDILRYDISMFDRRYAPCHSGLALLRMFTFVTQRNLLGLGMVLPVNTLRPYFGVLTINAVSP
jgi:hypothetical protein